MSNKPNLDPKDPRLITAKNPPTPPPIGCPLTGFVTPSPLGGIQYNRPGCIGSQCGFWITFALGGRKHEDCAIRSIARSLLALSSGGEDGK